MDKNLIDQLYAEAVISEASVQQLNQQHTNRLLSIHWEIKTLMYLAVLLLSGGLGILIYKNIHSIGQNLILIFLISLCMGSFWYCFIKKKPFKWRKVESPTILYDYLLLLSCLTMLTIIAYLQFQFIFFGERYGLATFIPMVLLFFAAYYFDNIAVLSLGITNLAAWLGVTVTPLEILQQNDFNNTSIILTGLALGVFLVATALMSKYRNLKKHFEFTYINFGLHIIFIASIAAMIHFDNVYILWFLMISGIAYYFYNKAISDQSFYILLVATLYEYFALSYVVVNLLFELGGFDTAPIYLGLLYFIASGIGLVLFLIKTNRKLKSNDSI